MFSILVIYAHDFNSSGALENKYYATKKWLESGLLYQDSIGLQIGIHPPLSKFYETPGFLGLMTETTGSVAAVFFHDIICNHDQHIIFNCFL